MYSTITYSGGTVWYQGTVGESVIKNLGSLNKIPNDPLVGNEYSYSITNTKGEYQLGTIQEGGYGYNEGGIYQNNILPNSYAANINAKAIITGNYNGQLLKMSTGGLDYILALPGILTTDTTVTNMQTILSNQMLAYNNYGNLPGSYNGKGYTMTGSFNYGPANPVVFAGNVANLVNSGALQQIMVNSLQTTYSGTQLSTDPNIASLLTTTTAVNKENLVRSMINNKAGGLISTIGVLPSISTTTSDISIGVNGSCIGLPSNAVYYNNTASYSLTNANNGTSLNAVTAGYSVSPIINTCQYTCTSGYSWNGSSCIINTYTISGSFGVNANGATISVCGSNVTADTSGNFTTTRNYGSTCNNIIATRAGYTCSTTTNGPTSLISNFTTVAGNCRGDQIYSSPGTYTWIAPAGVTSVSVVAVGGGAGGTNWYGGGGGGLGYINNFTVIPGNSYTVVVGGGGIGGASGTPGSQSYFVNTSTVMGGGGSTSNGGGAGGSYTGGGGGNGGAGHMGGGGGVGGYSGNGGDGSVGYANNGTAGLGGGGGGGGCGDYTRHTNSDFYLSAAGGGGGVGLFGLGSNGSAGGHISAGSNQNVSPMSLNFPGYGGGGGSNGSAGDNGTYGGTTIMDFSTLFGGVGGTYGGGGGGGGGTNATSAGMQKAANGGNGAVRIVYPGNTRQFPSTDVGI